MVQSSGKERGYVESLSYVDTIGIHEGRVCLLGKCEKSKLDGVPSERWDFRHRGWFSQLRLGNFYQHILKTGRPEGT